VRDNTFTPGPDPASSAAASRRRRRELGPALVLVALAIVGVMVALSGGMSKDERAAAEAATRQLVAIGAGDRAGACEHVAFEPGDPDGSPEGAYADPVTKMPVFFANTWPERCKFRLYSATNGGHDAKLYADAAKEGPRSVTSRRPGHVVVRFRAGLVTISLQMERQGGIWVERGAPTTIAD
jgi:hypothetical protein